MDLLDVGLIFQKGKQTNGLLSATDLKISRLTIKWNRRVLHRDSGALGIAEQPGTPI